MRHSIGAMSLLVVTLLLGCVNLDSARTPSESSTEKDAEDTAFAWIRMTTHGMT